MGNLLPVPDDIVINLFHYHILIYLDALARDESVHFLFYNSCSLLCGSKSGVTSNPIPPLLVRDWQK